LLVQDMRLHDYFDHWAMRHSSSEFATFEGRSFTYGEARARVNRFANALVAGGLGAGDRVSILSKNSIDYLLLFFAASKTGVVPVPLNYRLAPPEWAYIINDSASKAIFVSPEHVEALDPIRPELERTRTFVQFGAEQVEGWRDIESWSGSEDEAPAVEVLRDDVCFQMYTSGTTGQPKGAMITHDNVSNQITQMLADFEIPRGRTLVVAPLYHIAAAMTAFSTVAIGGSLWVESVFKPADVVTTMSAGDISFALLVPAMIQTCLVMVPDAGKRRYEALKVIAYGAAPIAESTLRQAMEVFKCRFVQGYGMTETTACITALSAEDHGRALAGRPELLLSAGKPVMGTEVRILDEQGLPAPPGTAGEIVARGPQVMKGYWNRPRDTAEALRGGWMHTGDAGRMDEEGFVFIEDRIKDMIVSGGENVYPREVEDVLFSHPAVADAAAIGVPHEKWGETVKAIVVLREGSNTKAWEIIEHCRDRLGGFKCPTSVDFVESLPRNPSGKVLKRDLREPYWKGQVRRVAGA
jgi:fatty-acyl-CoA synthase